MKDLQQMLDLLEQKRNYLLHYEKEMETMPLLAVDELEDCIKRGDVIIEKLKELDGRLMQLVVIVQDTPGDYLAIGCMKALTRTIALIRDAKKEQ